MVKLRHDAYTIALIYREAVEVGAILAMLDQRHESIPRHSRDTNSYVFGMIGVHNVIVVGPSTERANPKASLNEVVNQIGFSFRNVNKGMVVGIGSGIPWSRDTKLGDVAVSSPWPGPALAIVEYDFGRWTEQGIAPMGQLGDPPVALTNVVNSIERARGSDEERFLQENLWRIQNDPRLRDTYRQPDLTGGRRENVVRVHLGTVLSGDGTVPVGERDKVGRRYQHPVCFEKGAAGVMDILPCLVIRGICEMNGGTGEARAWEGYAAATAAAYAREVLRNLP